MMMTKRDDIRIQGNELQRVQKESQGKSKGSKKSRVQSVQRNSKKM
jgi:hypothetical protein